MTADNMRIDAETLRIIAEKLRISAKKLRMWGFSSIIYYRRPTKWLEYLSQTFKRLSLIRKLQKPWRKVDKLFFLTTTEVVAQQLQRTKLCFCVLLVCQNPGLLIEVETSFQGYCLAYYPNFHTLCKNSPKCLVKPHLVQHCEQSGLN